MYGLVGAILVGARVLSGTGQALAQAAPPVTIEWVVIDVAGNGVELCKAPASLEVAFGGRGGPLAGWTCPGSDDALLVLANPGRPIAIRDVLGLKLGPPNGFEHLAVAELSGPKRTSVDQSLPLFQRLALWTDANQDGTMVLSELVGLAFAGFERVDLAPAVLNEPDSHGNVVTGRAAAVRAGRSHTALSVRFATR